MVHQMRENKGNKMNFKLMLIGLMTIFTSLQSVKIVDPRKIFQLFKMGYVKKDVLKMHDNWMHVKGFYDKTNIPIFKYFLEDGSIRLSFFNFLKYPLFKNAKVVMYLEHDGQYTPVSSDCQGIKIEEVLSHVSEFSYDSPYVKNIDAGMSLECRPRSLVLCSTTTSENKILEECTNEHPYYLVKDESGREVKIFKPQYEEAVIKQDATEILFITHEKQIHKISLDENYF